MNNFVIKEITDFSIGYICPLCRSKCGSVKLENGFIQQPDLCMNCGYKYSGTDNNDKKDTVTCSNVGRNIDAGSSVRCKSRK